MSSPRLAIIDDNPEISRFIETVGKRMGYTIETTTDVSAAKIHEFLPNYADAEIIILDIIMPDIDGIEILLALARVACRAKIILISGYNPDYLEIAKQLGAASGLNIVATLKKPIKLKTLTSILDQG